MKRMKTFIAGLLFLGGLFILPSIPCWYTMQGVVLNGTTIQTIDGNIWEYDTSLPKGARVKIWLNDCDTIDKTDDIIITIWEVK